MEPVRLLVRLVGVQPACQASLPEGVQAPDAAAGAPPRGDRRHRPVPGQSAARPRAAGRLRRGLVSPALGRFARPGLGPAAGHEAGRGRPTRRGPWTGCCSRSCGYLLQAPGPHRASVKLNSVFFYARCFIVPTTRLRLFEGNPRAQTDCKLWLGLHLAGVVCSDHGVGDLDCGTDQREVRCPSPPFSSLPRRDQKPYLGYGVADGVGSHTEVFKIAVHPFVPWPVLVLQILQIEIDLHG
jgi:hypothetical protein